MYKENNLDEKIAKNQLFSLHYTYEQKPKNPQAQLIFKNPQNPIKNPKKPTLANSGLHSPDRYYLLE